MGLKCYREDCDRIATHAIRGIPMCDREYIEALEHGAHIVTANPISELIKAGLIEDKTK